jgi:glutamate--cysteine ligase
MMPAPLTRDDLSAYFLDGAKPRAEWRVGLELEKMGRSAADGRPLPYDAPGPSVRKVLESLRERRGGEPVCEGPHLIGLTAPWGAMSLEPGGQVEWSSPPKRSLAELAATLDEHLRHLRAVGADLGIRWLDLALEPDLPLSEMPWMPKTRYAIMRPYLGARGRLAHRMMTQTASIQCAFDFADATDWRRKFKTAAVLAPVAIALFANSSRLEGADTGYRCYRQAIWRETDPDRCGLPHFVFDRDFGIERWVDWVLEVPTFFLRRSRGLVPSGGIPFRHMLDGAARCKELETADWALHVSTIFTDVRSYRYIEVRTADLQPDDRAIEVPTFWTGTLYDDDAVGAALDESAGLDGPAWERAMDSAARLGLDGKIGKTGIREAASRALSAAARGLRRGAPCAGDPAEAVRPLERLAARHGLEIDA